MSMRHPLLIATLGYPGSGKTHFSELLAREEQLFHFNADRVRHMMCENPTYAPEEHRRLFAFMDKTTEDLLIVGTNVIYDANFNKRIHRAKLQEIATRADADYRLIWIQTPEEIALKRIGTRSGQDVHMYRPLSTEVFDALKAEIEEPDSSENVIAIDGEASFEAQLEVFRSKVGL